MIEVYDDEEDEDINVALDYLTTNYIRKRSRSIFEEMRAKWKTVNPKYKYIEKHAKINMLLVAKRQKSSTILSFLFDKPKDIEKICKSLSNKNNIVALRKRKETELENYKIDILITNKKIQKENIEKYIDFKYNNKKMGIFHGYPKEVTINKNTKSPNKFLDLNKKEEKILEKFINYQVFTKEQAEKALEEAKRRHKIINNIEENYSEYLFQKIYNRDKTEIEKSQNITKQKLKERTKCNYFTKEIPTKEK